MPVIPDAGQAPTQTAQVVSPVPEEVTTKQMSTPPPPPVSSPEPSAESSLSPRENYLAQLTERLPLLSQHDVIFMYKDILYKMHYVEESGKAISADWQKALDAKSEDAARLGTLRVKNGNVMESLSEEAKFLIREMKKRSMDHTKITVDPETQCEFFDCCKKKQEAMNVSVTVQVLLPCYYCEFNTVRSPLPNPNARFIVIDRNDISRHHKQLNLPMKLKKFTGTLVSMNVLEKTRYFLLNMADPVCKDTVLGHLNKLAQMQKMMQNQKILEEAVRETREKNRRDGAAIGTESERAGVRVGGAPASVAAETLGQAGGGVQGDAAGLDTGDSEKRPEYPPAAPGGPGAEAAGTEAPKTGEKTE